MYVSQTLDYISRRLTRLHWSQYWCNTRELRIEVAGIRSAGDLRLEWWLDSLMVDVIPIDVSKKWLAHDFLCIGWSASKTLFRFPSEQLLQDRNRISRHVNRVQRLISENCVVDFVFVFSSEGRLLEKHLVDQNTERPPVDCSTVLLV